jgi:mannose-1-phosphate guanylyltransferase
MVANIIGLVALSCSAIVRADDYKAPADVAYCIGSLRKQDEITKILLIGNTDHEVAVRREAEQKLLEKQTFVESAIKQGTLFPAIASRMINDGYADANLCTQVNSKCTLEHIKRLQDNVDKAASEAEFDDCTRPIVASCNRIRKCDE